MPRTIPAISPGERSPSERPERWGASVDSERLAIGAARPRVAVTKRKMMRLSMVLVEFSQEAEGVVREVPEVVRAT